MRSFHVVAIVLSVLGAGVVGWFARGRCAANPPVDAPFPADDTTPSSGLRPVHSSVQPSSRMDSGAADDRLADLVRRMEALATEVAARRGEESTRWAGISSEIEALKAQVAAIAVTQEAIAKKAGVPPPWPSDPAEVEKIRERWRAKLEETEKTLRALYPQGADPRGDVVAWSRFDDHRRAKAALDAATDSASLRALTEGEFRNYFVLTR